MCVADQRIDRDLRPHHASEAAHFTESGDPHFHDRRPIVGRDARERHRDADLIVQVFIGLAYAQAACKHGGDHFLGRSLSHAARDADDRERKRFPICCGDILQSRLHVVCDDHAARLPCRDTLSQAAGGAFVERGGDIVVPVDALALIGDEEIARLDVPAVDHDAAKPGREIALSAVSSAAGGACFFNRHPRHGLTPP